MRISFIVVFLFKLKLGANYMYEYKFIEVSVKGMFIGGDDHRKNSI
ncbi:MAG: hypothetical protein ACRCYC_02550 [Paraclostridium sp.]